jgi:hypothetical protein
VIGRLRLGELMVLSGVGCLIACLFAPCYQSPAGNLDLWDTFGTGAVLLLATLCAGLAVVVAALSERNSTALPVSTAVWSVLLGLLGTIAALVRVLERPDHATALCYGAWLGLAGTLLVLLGSWQAIRDERPSRYRPARPEARPHP